MIELKNVSKFYYNKGIIASGFTKVSLKFDKGEMVAITGESGSGKSTLLNVISGLDSYEEGEMYINGKETSHYREKDFEDYRRKYIGNIFQSFNLINSYTVYQNIDLILMINGTKRCDRKSRVLELIKKVDLYKFRNTKVSKLSGGQKQRVAIARALAKDTPIIIADEPTGNLDKKSSEGVIKLLSQVAKDKLVIIVTHNYDQVEEYVTRKITMHDGRVVEDKVIKKAEIINDNLETKHSNISFINKIRLGIRNAFNIKSKFTLLFMVYIFMVAAFLFEYASLMRNEYDDSITGYSQVFSDTSDKRIVFKKNNGEVITDEDYKKVEDIKNVDYIVKNDLLLDSNISLSSGDFWFNPNIYDISLFNSKLSAGVMPKEDNEIILVGNKDEIYIDPDILFSIDSYIVNGKTGEVNRDYTYKITGIMYSDDYKSYMYASSTVIDRIRFSFLENNSKITVKFNNKKYNANYGEFNLYPTDKVAPGEAYISSDYDATCKKETCVNYNIEVNVKNIYINDTKNYKITKTYNKENIKKILGIDSIDSVNGNLFINTNDYNSLFNKGNFQSSLFVTNQEQRDSVIKELNEMGYYAIKVSDTMIHFGSSILAVVRSIVTVVLAVALFFISYFIIRIILKSRNSYYAIIRMLGANVNQAKSLLRIELLTVANLAYFIFLGLTMLAKYKVINTNIFNIIFMYLKFKDYLVLYLIIIVISLLISYRYSKQLFKKSAMKTFFEEV